jgi:hypothetical protein
MRCRVTKNRRPREGPAPNYEHEQVRESHGGKGPGGRSRQAPSVRRPVGAGATGPAGAACRAGRRAQRLSRDRPVGLQDVTSDKRSSSILRIPRMAMRCHMLRPSLSRSAHFPGTPVVSFAWAAYSVRARASTNSRSAIILSSLAQRADDIEQLSSQPRTRLRANPAYLTPPNPGG